MREAEKREYDEEQKYQELVRRAKELYPTVKESTDANGNRIITLISCNKKVTRKDHSFRECDLKSGDWLSLRRGEFFPKSPAEKQVAFCF